MYREIDFESVVKTLNKLEKRIQERFPSAGLSGVCHELIDITGETQANLVRISNPNIWLRSFVALVIGLSLFLIIYTLSATDFKTSAFSFAEFVQVLESAVNDLVIIGVAIIFLVSLESRIKQKKVVSALNELRAIAHVIDMHQLTKDPTEIGETNQRTASSPERSMSAFLLKRYLDYCSEMLSIIGKMAAIYAQRFPENKVVASVNEVETLTTGISRKIWQKIMILEMDKNE